MNQKDSVVNFDYSALMWCNVVAILPSRETIGSTLCLWAFSGVFPVVQPTEGRKSNSTVSTYGVLDYTTHPLAGQDNEL